MTADDFAVDFLTRRLHVPAEAVSSEAQGFLAETRRLVADAVREDRLSRASDEGVREVLRGLEWRIDAMAKAERRRGAEAGDLRDSASADEASHREEALVEVRGLVVALLGD